jgi:hypothetical protein
VVSLTVLCGFEMRSVTLRGERKLLVYKKELFRKLFGHYKDDVVSSLGYVMVDFESFTSRRRLL